MSNENLKSNLLSVDHWMRLVFMILFSVFLFVADTILKVLVAIQFLFALLTGSDNTNLRQFGDSLSQFIYAILRFLTYNTNDKPFPFAPWPEAAPIAEKPIAEKPVVEEAAKVDSSDEKKEDA